MIREVAPEQVKRIWSDQMEWDSATVRAGGLHAACNLCGARGNFRLEHAMLRETARCPSCTSFARQRAVALLLDRELQAAELGRPKVLLLESTGPLVKALRARQVAGELRLHCAEFGPTNVTGLRDEARPGHVALLDLCAVEPDVQHFDIVLHLDVLEHVQDLQASLEGLARLLAPGGTSIFTAPLDGPGGRHRVRTRGTGEQRELLLEPIHHGDPSPRAADASGSLVYTDIGVRDLAADAARRGLDLRYYRIWDYAHAVLGQSQVVMTLRHQ